MVTQWNISGSYLETCNCDVACPCVFGTPPPPGACTVLLGWHIDSGSFDEVALDGLNVALAASIPGLPAAGNWTAAIYVDDRASEDQRSALADIFTGNAGGPPGALLGAITEVLGVTSAVIGFEVEGKRRRLHVRNIAEAEIETLADPQGSPVTINNLPRWISRGFPLTVAKSTRLSYRDHGQTWELSEKNGYCSPFSYAGP